MSACGSQWPSSLPYLCWPILHISTLKMEAAFPSKLSCPPKRPHGASTEKTSSWLSFHYSSSLFLSGLILTYYCFHIFYSVPLVVLCFNYQHISFNLINVKFRMSPLPYKYMGYMITFKLFHWLDWFSGHLTLLIHYRAYIAPDELKEKRPLERPRHKWENNVEINLR
jgi:hypothetical protein